MMQLDSLACASACPGCQIPVAYVEQMIVMNASLIGSRQACLAPEKARGCYGL